MKERFRYSSPGGTFTLLRELETREMPKAPVPATYTCVLGAPRRKEELTIRFDRVAIDAAHPVVRDSKARDGLQAAWKRRFVLPEDLRLEGAFTRKPGKALRRAGWSDVAGRFRVWGMEKIDVVLDDRYRDQPRGDETEDACRKDLVWAFGLLRDRPFGEEFSGCGYEREDQETGHVIHVYGHPRVLAYRIADGALAGHADRVAGEKGWWTWKTRPNRDGTVLLEGMRRRLGGRTVALAFRYGRVQGRQVPKSVSALAISEGRDAAVGVVEYSLKRLKITPR